MKRFAALSLLMALLAFNSAAAVWDGSAVAGGFGDFPGDGLYGACNSFPRDTSVTLTNLENGKTVTITITKGIDNPGVFIALSPKAAEELGMRSGSAARIRAVAITASQADTSLPSARAGETADPDFNPKVYVDREKAAVRAAASSTPSEAPVPGPAMAAAPEAAAPPVESPAVASPAVPLGNDTALAELPEARAPPLPEGEASKAPEMLGGALPEPAKPAGEEPGLADPARPSEEEIATAEGSHAPETSAQGDAAEPMPAPEELPELILSRVVAPSDQPPQPLLAEAEAPALEESSESQPEELTLEHPSYAAQVEEPKLAEAAPLEPTSASEAPAGIADNLPDTAPPVPEELGEPETASPSESIAAEQPKPIEPGLAPAEAAPPGSSELSVVLEPAAPRPPQAEEKPAAPGVAAAPGPAATPVETQPKAPAVPIAAPSSVPLLKGLAKGSVYVQIGVYGSNESLKTAIGGFRSTYPLAIESLTTKAGGAAFRLLVGPLSRDEGGVVLLRIRSLGFKDAYLKTGS